MTTATTNTVIDHTSDAGFRAWVAEIVTMLFTTLGVTQTGDTGQINTATVTRPGTNTAAGYVIGRFNDAAQSTTPIFFKLEFGTGGLVTTPGMWITVGAGSSGAGAITGLSTTRVNCGSVSQPVSTVASYLSRGCYNTTAGFLGFVGKLNALSTNEGLFGFAIYRSADNTGAVTTDAVMLLTNSTSSSPNSSQGAAQAISHLTGAAYTTTPWPNTSWGYFPFLLQSTLYLGNAQIGPVFQYTPVLGVTPWLGIVLVGELAVGATQSMTLVGATPHTYLSVGSGVIGSCSSLTEQNLQCTGGGASTYSIIMLWE